MTAEAISKAVSEGVQRNSPAAELERLAYRPETSEGALQSDANELLQRFTDRAINVANNHELSQIEAINDIRIKRTQAETREYRLGETDRIHPFYGKEGEEIARVSKPEHDIFRDLNPEKVNGLDFLTRTDIDLDQKDALGRTNQERMDRGLAPIGEDGMPIEIHHVEQSPQGPYAELTHAEHHSPQNFRDLHPKGRESDVAHGPDWHALRREHWQERAKNMTPDQVMTERRV